MCADDDHLYITCLTAPGRVVKVAIADGTIDSIDLAMGNSYPTSIAVFPYLLPVTTNRDYIWVGMGEVYGIIGDHSRFACIPRDSFASPIYPPCNANHEGIVSLAHQGGIAVFALRDSADQHFHAFRPGDLTPGGPTIDYLAASYTSTLTNGRKVIISPAGAVYLVPWAGDEDVVRTAGVHYGRGGLEEAMAIGCSSSDYNYFDGMHDGRSLWVIGEDAAAGEGLVMKCPV
jgi:hypothetical protein